jgi:hypothetical protein
MNASFRFSPFALALLFLLPAPWSVSQDKNEKTSSKATDDKEASSNKSPVKIEEVRKLLRALDGAQLKDRDAAEKSLVELGGAILPFLPEIDANTSGEMKVRLQRIRQQLQQIDVETFFEESKVTLSGKMLIREALTKIREQTGNEVEIDPEAASAFQSTMVELEMKDASFWTVMEEVMKQSKLRINTFGTGTALSLIPGAEEYANMPKTVNKGPYRIGVVSTQSSLPFGSRLGGQLDLSLMLHWEPRMKPIFMQLPMQTLTATTDDGQSLSAVSQDAYPEVALNTGGCSSQIDLQLQRPARKSTKLQKVSGEFTIAIPSERHKYIFKKFANGSRQSEKFGQVSVTLEGARRNGAVFEMRILVEFGNAQGALDSFRGWVLSNEAYLLDPKERKLENVGFQTYAITSDSVGVAYLFQINGNPDEFQLIYESPASIAKHSVKYELEDIELP